MYLINVKLKNQTLAYSTCDGNGTLTVDERGIVSTNETAIVTILKVVGFVEIDIKEDDKEDIKEDVIKEDIEEEIKPEVKFRRRKK